LKNTNATKSLLQPKLLSSEDKLQKEEELRLMLSSEGSDLPMTEELTPDASLQLLKETLAAAHTKQVTVCNEGARLINRRHTELPRFSGVALSKAMSLLDSLICSNTLELEAVEKEIKDISSRIKSLEVARKALLAPVVHDIAVDDSNPIHAAIKRTFKFSLIPVLSDGTTID